MHAQVLEPDQSDNGLFQLKVIVNYASNRIELEWSSRSEGRQVAALQVLCTGQDEMTWLLAAGGKVEKDVCGCHRGSIRARLRLLSKRFPVSHDGFSAESRPRGNNGRPLTKQLAFPPSSTPWSAIENEITCMARELRGQFSPPLQPPQPFEPDLGYAAVVAEAARRDRERLEKEQAGEARQRQAIAELRARQLQGQAERAKARKAREAELAAKEAEAKMKPAEPAQPPPAVSLRFEPPALDYQQTCIPLADLKGYFLRERAARWWVSNQSDDLLCLPYCRIERLEYQLRSALRVIGPLRGRALLSDEVGLGKTVEAGLVLKEYLTRGMVKRALILTVPSLVDQWEEELADKFNLSAATTNQPQFRADPAAFWRSSPLVVASLHTLKQPAQLEVARTASWDLLVVDEAHYLRNRDSQSWQAVNVLPRQFLLLLTATPVQNSLEELYNLVTLLQPGQLPPPREFRARFMDKSKPHQPREPEELRRLLGQVMIRNTRANSGIQLPPRRAETVLFEPETQERAFWEEWDQQFRAALARLAPNQAKLWGRLLLQAAGSSPMAWRDALEKFPDRSAAKNWLLRAPLEASWKKKCAALPSLACHEGGVVLFTQFLKTQAALAEAIRATNLRAWMINGQTPAPERQPITERFRKEGGVLLLTHSGTEGRNLQFCHRLVNFDLPWNPMEIEQRIGRLHRLGQQQPVRIYNFVQAGTLQEHLLNVLQEKLNLFELVVGETGLILGDRFTSDEFEEEILRRWQESDGAVAEAMQKLGEELATARDDYQQIKQLDETLFAKDYETL